MQQNPRYWSTIMEIEQLLGLARSSSPAKYLKSCSANFLLRHTFPIIHVPPLKDPPFVYRRLETLQFIDLRPEIIAQTQPYEMMSNYGSKLVYKAPKQYDLFICSVVKYFKGLELIYEVKLLEALDAPFRAHAPPNCIIFTPKEGR